MPKGINEFQKKIFSVTMDTHETVNNMLNMHESASGNHKKWVFGESINI